MDDVSGVAVASPADFVDMKAVGDTIRATKPIAVELRRVDTAQMRRCIDFIMGAGYVAGAKVEKIADRVFLVTPEGTELSTRQRDALTQHFG